MSRRIYTLPCLPLVCSQFSIVLFHRYDDLESIEISESHATPSGEHDSSHITNNLSVNKHSYSSQMNNNQLQNGNSRQTGNNKSSSLEASHSKGSFKKSFLYNLIARSQSQNSMKNSQREQPPPISAPPPEVLECITTSFNERVPTPEHMVNNNHCSSRHLPLSRISTASNSPPPTCANHCSKLPVNNRYSLESCHSPLLARFSNNSNDSHKSYTTCRSEHSLIHYNSTADQTLSATRSHHHKSPLPNRLSLNKMNSGGSNSGPRRNERKQDGKAAKTLSAILFAFIITWSPYHLFTLINAFDSSIIPDVLYSIGEFYGGKYWQEDISALHTREN